jgi:hypothetical protein
MGPLLVAALACGTPQLAKLALHLMPAAGPEDACALAEASSAAARQAKLDPRWLLVLAALESSGRRVHVWYPSRSGWGARADLSWWQIHSTTALAFGCDMLGLVGHSPQAGAECAAKVLKEALTRCAVHGIEAVGCYHSATDWRRAQYASHFWRLLP